MAAAGLPELGLVKSNQGTLKNDTHRQRLTWNHVNDMLQECPMLESITGAAVLYRWDNPRCDPIGAMRIPAT
jgi:hypothetical protein